MAEPDVGVAPYWELTFDADGDVDVHQRDRLTAQLRDRDVRDLVVFAHGWNNDRSTAIWLYDRFFAPFPSLAPGARLGYVGVLWPSMRFTDEPIPDYPHAHAVAAGPSLDPGTRQALAAVFPDCAAALSRIAQLLDERPDDPAALDEYVELVRRLATAGPQACAADADGEGDPAMLHDDPLTVCRGLADALAAVGARPAGGTAAAGTAEGTGAAQGAGAPNGSGHAGTAGAAPAPGQQTPFLGDGLAKVWEGARELLRQVTYFTMKRRAGTVGAKGLGPAVGHLAQAAPGVRVHLVGHSFGGRLVSFALDGLPDGVRSVKSVTLLQGAFSHYAFAARLPHGMHGSGALNGRERRVDGPLVCCFSRHDTALGVMYPLASRMSGDATSVFGLDGATWGAMGHDGVQSVDGATRLALADALGSGLPATGFISVDAAGVVRRGGPPAGAHSDICHPELARVVLAAGRIR
ncbi:serine-threonine protein kinase [Streptomyces sp. NPDC002004]